MPENNGLGDSGGGGNFLCGGSLEALAREEVEGDFEELAAAVFGGETLGHGTIVSQCLLTMKGVGWCL